MHTQDYNEPVCLVIKELNTLAANVYIILDGGYLVDSIFIIKVEFLSAALLGYTTNKKCEDYIPYLNQNTRALFWNDFNYLKNTLDRLLDKWTVENAVSIYNNNQIIEECSKLRKFDDVIEASNNLIRITPKNMALYNTLGYALPQQKKYEEAIIAFTKAIDTDAYLDYPYNNRGYYKLKRTSIS